MDIKKSALKIDNFSDLLANNFEEKEEIQKISSESQLASFRIQSQSSNKSSNPSSPYDMRGLPISPIRVVIEPERNFSSETKEFEKEISQPKFINIMSAPSDEENQDIEHSISLLTPNLKKLKMNQFTPTFPVKNDDNISWDDVSMIKEQANLMKENKIQNPLEFSDISNIEKDSRSAGIGTYSEFPTLLDAQIIKTGETPKDSSQEAQPELKVKPLEDHQIQQEKMLEKESFELTQTFIKNNETLIFETEEKNERRRTCYSEKSTKKRLLFKTPSTPSMIPIKKITIVNSSSIFSSNTPLVKIKKSKSGSVNPARIKSKSRVSIDLKTTGSPEALKTKAKAKTMKLPKLKEETKAKTKTQFVPYMSDWSKTTLKTHFKIELKASKDPNAVKTLVSKIVKKRSKILKVDNVK
jgi:hypothetical protein